MVEANVSTRTCSSENEAVYPESVTDTMKAVTERTKSQSNPKSGTQTGMSPFAVSPTTAVVLLLLGVPLVLTDDNPRDATAFLMTAHSGRI